MIKDVKQTRTHRSAKIPQKVLEKHNIHLKKILSGFELRKNIELPKNSKRSEVTTYHSPKIFFILLVTFTRFSYKFSYKSPIILIGSISQGTRAFSLAPLNKPTKF